MYININNNVTLSIRQFLLLLTIIFILFALYYRLFVSNHCFPIEKYKSLVKKYKLMVEKYQDKLATYDDLINTQNSIIQEYSTFATNSQNQIGSHSSAHSGALTPSRFNSSSNTSIMSNKTITDPKLIQQINKQTNNASDAYLMSSIDHLLQRENNVSRHENNLAIADPNLNNIYMQANGPSSFDTFWQT